MEGGENINKTPTLYKYVENGETLYIGKTISLARRAHEHALEQRFLSHVEATVFFAEYSTMQQLDVAERLLISKYKPRLNRQFCDNNFPFVQVEEPDWKIWLPPAMKPCGKKTMRCGICKTEVTRIGAIQLSYDTLDFDEDGQTYWRGFHGHNIEYCAKCWENFVRPLIEFAERRLTP